MQDTDILIVGGGAAGAVLASRLSEHSSLRVTLVEAGIDTPPEAVPDDIADSFPRAYANSGYFWPALKASTRSGAAPRPYNQAQVMGGGSNVMGMWGLRGFAADYDGWEAAGAKGWGWADVLPYFKKLERDADFADEGHGSEGPVTLARIPPDKWPVFTRTLAEAATREQFRIGPDLNGSEEDGIYAIPMSIEGKTRVSSASAYLTDTVRRRPNLTIFSDTEARTLAFDGRVAVGAHVRHRDGTVALIRARETIIACGALHSPALLQRSGVGKANDLATAGINVVADLPGVGAHLQNHFFVHLGAIVRPAARQDPALRRYGMVGVRLSSGIKDAPPGDLFVSFIARTGGRNNGNRFGMVGPSLYAPFSRGSVRLDPSDPQGSPIVDFNALGDPRDDERLIYAARFARRLLEDSAVRAIIQEAFIIPQNLPIRFFNQPGLASALFSAGAAAVFGSGTLARRAAIRMMMGPGRLLSEIGSEERFAELVREAVTPMFHVSGTCAMGSVVDPEGRVYGIDGLRVVDASIMPTIPRANTNIPTIMLAEKCADHIAAGLRSG